MEWLTQPPHNMKLITCLLFGVLIASAFAQPAPMNGPYVHQVHSATSKDGLTWTRDEGIRLEHASVPCAIADGNARVHLYFVDGIVKPGIGETVGSAVSTNGVDFQRVPFKIEGLSVRKAVDPSIIKDSDGKYRLYYLASNGRGDPGSDPGLHAINLAQSDDGISFHEIKTVFRYEHLVDPDVFRFKDKWFMYVFARRGTVIATSTNGLDFTYVTDLALPGWGTTAPVLFPDGKLRLYAFEQRKPGANTVCSFLSEDGIHWTKENGVRLQAKANEQITDPYVVPWQGGYKMYFKASPAVHPRKPQQPRFAPQQPRSP